MKFSMAAIALALATVAVAAPGGQYGHPQPSHTDIDYKKISKACGQAQVSCCNKKTGDSLDKDTNSGLLNGVLGTVLSGGSSFSLFDTCSKLPIVGDILGGDSCKTNIACCQENPINQQGLVNVGIPCIPITDLL